MHVALLSHEYPPYIFGGIGTFTKNLAYGLSKQGIKVTVVTGCPASRMYLSRHSPHEECNNNITIIRYPYPNIPPRHAMFQLANLRGLYKTVDKIDADIIHGQGGSTFPSLINLKNLAPVVVTFHSSPKAERLVSWHSFGRGGSFRDLWTYFLGYPVWSYTTRAELQNSNLAVAVSKTLRSDIIDELGDGFSGKIQEIHNGIDLETIDKEYYSLKEHAAGFDKTIFFAGRMFWRKGALNLVEFAYHLQKINSGFKIIAHGDGPLLNQIRNRINSLGLTNIELKGFTSKNQLLTSMRKSRFVIVPSFYEACPMTLLESMCLGKIPLMLTLPFALEFTDHGRYGILSKDVRTLVDKLTAGSSIDLQSFSDEIRRYSRTKYDITNVSSRYLQVYKHAQNHFNKGILH